MKKNTKRIVLLIIFCTFYIIGCSDNDDLNNYINEVKFKPAMKIEPLPKFTPLPKFIFPENYNRRDPFKPIDEKKVVDTLAPNQKRPKEPLESFPLDALKFVGTFKQGAEKWGLIKQPNDKITFIRVGQYMGQNYGKVILIKNDSLKLEELIKKGEKWEKQVTTINLTEPGQATTPRP